MTCMRCGRSDAEPDGILCTRCAAASAASTASAVSAAQAPEFDATSAAWLRSPVGLGRAAIAALGLVVAADLFGLGADYVMYDAMGGLVDGEPGQSGFGLVVRADDLLSAAGIVQTSALVISIVVFLCWFHRVRVNAQVFAPFGHSKKGHWAIWGWFVPVVNLWVPRRVTLDIWDASSPWGAPRGHGLVNTWWTLWLLSLAADRAADVQSRQAETAQEIQDASAQLMFADVSDILAALLAILVVLRLTGMQRMKVLGGPTPVAA